jgi:hemerythrin-like domain-containing protein
MNATNATIERLPSAPTSVRQPRFDLYGPIHKTIRLVVSDLLVRLGKTNFGDETAALPIATELEKVLDWCEVHIEHEVRFIHPHLAARLPNALAKIDQEHVDHARLVMELRGLIAGVRSAPTNTRRSLAGATLYLHFTTYFADTLAHMVEEERVLQPLMYRFFTDEELLEMNASIIASIPPEEMFETLIKMIPAANGPERAGILAGARAGAPPEAFRALVGALRPHLDDREWTELLALCPYLA